MFCFSFSSLHLNFPPSFRTLNKKKKKFLRSRCWRLPISNGTYSPRSSSLEKCSRSFSSCSPYAICVMPDVSTLKRNVFSPRRRRRRTRPPPACLRSGTLSLGKQILWTCCASWAMQLGEPGRDWQPGPFRLDFMDAEEDDIDIYVYISLTRWRADIYASSITVCVCVYIFVRPAMA